MPMVTMADVAALAGVSQATVSHVINETTYVSPRLRRRVLRAVQELDYHPDGVARSLRTKQSRTVGMIVPNISDPFFDTIVRGAEDVLADQGHTLIIGNSDDNMQKEEAYYRTFREKRVAGILLIVSSSEEGPPAYLKPHSPTAGAIVYLDRYYRRLGGDSVVLDDAGGSLKAVAHLISCGHRRIATITGPLNLLNAYVRLEGYKRALAGAGITFDDALVREGRFDMPSGESRTKELLGLRPPITALYVGNALMAIGALRAFKKCGIRCPEDVALVSHNDLEWFDLLQPTITAVQHPVYDLGAIGAEILLKRINGRLVGPHRRSVLKSELVVRESTGKSNWSENSQLKDASMGFGITGSNNSDQRSELERVGRQRATIDPGREGTSPRRKI